MHLRPTFRKLKSTLTLSWLTADDNALQSAVACAARAESVPPVPDRTELLLRLRGFLKKINNNALELDFTHALQPVCRIFILLWSWQKEKSWKYDGLVVQNAIPFDELSNEKYSKKKIPFKILVFRVFLYFFLQISEKLAEEFLFGFFFQKLQL